MTRLGLAIVAILLVGCVGTPANTPAGPASQETSASAERVLPWIMTDCLEVSAYYSAPAANVKPLLPAGFEPQPDGTTGLAGMARLGANAFRCKSEATATNETVMDTSSGGFFAQVRPTDEFKMQGLCCYFVKWNVVVQDEGIRDALQAANASVNSGKADITMPPTAAGGPARVKLDIEGVGTVTFTIVTIAPTSQGHPRFREFSMTGGDLVVWESTADYKDTLVGQGTIDVPSGSLPAQIYGNTRIPAQFTVNHMSIKDGWIKIPASVPDETAASS